MKPPPQASAQEPDSEVEQLIARLREPAGRVQFFGTLIPGGEVLQFSPPMKELIRLGARALPALHRLVGEEAIRNEVVLVLGAIGDRETVPLLIDAYPTDDVRGLGSDDPRWVRVMCFSFALPYLTGQQIGRDRSGADFDPENRQLWRRWWAVYGWGFSVSADKPNATWVPHYPSP
ncbi:HEAT repeat domain-containing protein [Gemmata obscuriglobus]|uniref:HEAT repeat domain-containing protein n=1 Tax=Gemmata obscuriglobus TaxID=114 RepID=UPI0011CD5FCA|nr:HEAT repeat domain-containing protein [Gemmata obscuriglobus]